MEIKWKTWKNAFCNQAIYKKIPLVAKLKFFMKQ